MNRFKPIFSSQSCSLSGSDPNQSLRDDDLEHMFAQKPRNNLNRRVNGQSKNFERLITANHSAEVKLTAEQSLNESFEPLALFSQSMEVELNDFPQNVEQMSESIDQNSDKEDDADDAIDNNENIEMIVAAD